jgi:hypothetical protein
MFETPILDRESRNEWETEALMDAKEDFNDMCKQVWDMVSTEGMGLDDAMYAYLYVREI